MHSPADLPLTRDLVLVGGGHAHALVLLRWIMRPMVGARLTLINPDPTAPYTGMLPGHVAGHYPREALEIDLVALCLRAGARFVRGSATAIDRKARLVTVSGRPPVGYDVLSLDVGITAGMPQLPGFETHAHAAKPLGPFADSWATFVEAVRTARMAPTVAVIGGGVAGVELALAMAWRLRSVGARPEVRLVENGPRILRDLGERAARRLAWQLASAGIEVLAGAETRRITAAGLELADGRTVPARFVAGAAGATPHPWLADTGLALDRGFVRVGPTLQSETDARIFAVGDCASLVHAPRPKAGVFAVRAAPILDRNLRIALAESGAGMIPFRPQRDYLKLISTGRRAAVGEKFGLVLSGARIWRLKDRIDRRFMDRFRALPPMPAPARPAAAAADAAAGLDRPFCAGCGSKVGGGVLARVLDGLPPPRRADVVSRPGDDAAVLDIGGARQVITVDHLRALTEDPWLMTRIAAVHALGDVWAMGAAPQAALASIVLPRMSEPLQERTLAEIMSAASEVFRAAGAEVVGGHTTMGAEMTIGFAVTGLVADGRVIGLAGAGPGDALILTKPLGTGIVLAAAMRGAAGGSVVSNLLSAMAVPQQAAARILAARARAMTDVTGFGLAGHLGNICAASGGGAEVWLDRLPVYPGAAALAAAGHESVLAPANRRDHAARFDDPSAAPAVLFDPQTAGGLLAAVPSAEADDLLAAIRETGLAEAAIIGTVTAAAGRIAVRSAAT
ncbi:MAG: selenide, water dikinase SelD [Gemmobacter sp.]